MKPKEEKKDKTVLLYAGEGEKGLEVYVHDNFSMQLKYLKLLKAMLEGSLIEVNKKIAEEYVERNTGFFKSMFYKKE